MPRSAFTTGPLAVLALVTTCAGVVVACDKSTDSPSMTTTTSAALYDAGVMAAPVDNGALSEPAMAARPSDPNARPTPSPDVSRYGQPGAPIPRAVAPDSPANGTYGTGAIGATPGAGAGHGNSAGSMNAPYGNSMNNPTGATGNGVGSVNDGNSAGSMNGTRPMNQLGSSSSPYRSSNGATDAPNRVPSPPNAVP